MIILCQQEGRVASPAGTRTDKYIDTRHCCLLIDSPDGYGYIVH
jgi:hypothetical protein